MGALPIYFLKGTTQEDENEVRPKAYTFGGTSLRNSMQKHMHPLHKEMTPRTLFAGTPPPTSPGMWRKILPPLQKHPFRTDKELKGHLRELKGRWHSQKFQTLL